MKCSVKSDIFYFFGLEGLRGRTLGTEFPVSLSNHVSFTPRLLHTAALPAPQKVLSN